MSSLLYVSTTSVSSRLGHFHIHGLSDVLTGNGSDVFGSDICTCRPYLTFGIEEAVKEAQKGGSGVVIYFRKEGRALGEVSSLRPCCIEGKNAENNRSLNILFTMPENVAPTVQANTSSVQKTSPESRTCVS
jgi:hypothetical protein